MWKKFIAYKISEKGNYYETAKEYSCSNSTYQFQLAFEKSDVVVNGIIERQVFVVYIKFPMIKDDVIDQNITYYINIPTWELKLSNNIKKTGQDMLMKLTEKHYTLLHRETIASHFDSVTFNITVYISESRNVPPFKNMFEDKELADLELVGEDGSVLVHKYVFASLSEVFLKMLNGTWREAKEAKVKIPDATVATLEQFKEFIYLGSIPQENWEPVVELSCRYMIQGIEEKLIQMYQNSITIENFCLFKKFAEKYNLNKLFLILLDTVHSQMLEVQLYHALMIKD